MTTAPNASSATIEGRSLERFSPNALSHSRLNVLQRCQRRFYIEYERGMERITDKSEALRMGGAFAKALELADPKSAFVLTYSPLLDAAQSQAQIDALMIESALVEYYAGKYLEIYGPTEFREVEYEFPIPGTNHTFRGAADGIIPLPNVPNAFVGVEDKFKGRWTEQDSENLALDTQITAEVFGLRQLGYNVNRVSYRVTVKPTLLRKKGRGKNPVPETVAEYVGRCIEAVEAEPEKFFIEECGTHTTRTEEQLADWLSEMQDYAFQIDAMRERGKYPRSKDTCSYRGGCAHREICCGIPSAVSLYQIKPGYPGSENCV